jgi:hypothetical protein
MTTMITVEAGTRTPYQLEDIVGVVSGLLLGCLLDSDSVAGAASIQGFLS